MYFNLDTIKHVFFYWSNEYEPFDFKDGYLIVSDILNKGHKQSKHFLT
jgi:hypothetical protein